MTATVYVLRKDDYDGPVRLTLQDAPEGFLARPVVVPKGQTVGKLVIRAPSRRMQKNVTLRIVGTARVGSREIVHTAVAAEDKMQAFLWRHLVPAGDLITTVFDPAHVPAMRRPLPVPAQKREARVAAAATEPPKPKFTKQQVAGRLRQLKTLYEAGLLTDSFYLKKVEECETTQ